MAAPGVLATIQGIWPQGTTELGIRKSSDLVGHTHGNRRGVESRHGFTELAEQRGLTRELIAMRVEPAQRTHKHLATQAQRIAGVNQTRHLLQLLTDASGRKCYTQTGDAR